MRRILAAAAGLAALAGAAGIAMAQTEPAQAPERGVSRLWQGDSNNDGVLTRQEFDAARAAHFGVLDQDNNGQVSRAEFRELRGERHERRGRRGHRGGMRHLAGADANEDGAVTREEFLARPIAHFERLDANDDGVISANERPQRRERGERHGRRSFDSNNDRQISRGEFASMGERMFERLDANDDGRVTREEAEAARHHRRGRH
ncbi:MAG TPA: hypothetical protein VEA80_15515 [Vitreimonas sp.]|uniref:EF-hand domain-containing protein n=1 Tax=Vitreimonas sp. TaxID=3069702 RepID=UPI002D4629BE|nr:hypothetical protein [Vitreimonas sp.]HYD88882.1 hypothetical protein [Vitreimonas sp.]